MIYKNGVRMRDFLGLFVFYCSLVFYILGSKCLVGYLSSHIQRALVEYLTIIP